MSKIKYIFSVLVNMGGIMKSIGINHDIKNITEEFTHSSTCYEAVFVFTIFKYYLLSIPCFLTISHKVKLHEQKVEKNGNKSLNVHCLWIERSLSQAIRNYQEFYDAFIKSALYLSNLAILCGESCERMKCSPLSGPAQQQHPKLVVYLFLLDPFFQPWQFQLLLMLPITCMTNNLIRYLAHITELHLGNKITKDNYQHESELVNLSLLLSYATLRQRKYKSQEIMKNYAANGKWLPIKQYAVWPVCPNLCPTQQSLILQMTTDHPYN